MKYVWNVVYGEDRRREIIAEGFLITDEHVLILCNNLENEGKDLEEVAAFHQWLFVEKGPAANVRSN